MFDSKIIYSDNFKCFPYKNNKLRLLVVISFIIFKHNNIHFQTN